MSTDQLAAVEAIVLHMGAIVDRLSDDEFFDFCQRNRELRIESTRDGDLIIKPPTGGETGHAKRLGHGSARQLEGMEPLELDAPDELDADDVLPGFTLKLTPLWAGVE